VGEVEKVRGFTGVRRVLQSSGTVSVIHGEDSVGMGMGL
jgi:hypothetical protein